MSIIDKDQARYMRLLKAAENNGFELLETGWIASHPI
jgi:hypothetical protein